MKLISKKAYKDYFELVLRGEKTFDLRAADFDVETGDTLELVEIDADKNPTGRTLRKKIGTVAHTKKLESWYDPKVVADNGYVVMSVKNDDATIDDWLQSFCNEWQAKNIDGILALFADDTLYYESPHKSYNTKADFSEEWQAVLDQENISIQAKRLSSENDLYTVQWELNYDKNGKHHRWDGLYLIALNTAGICTYFYQVGEEKKWESR